VPVARMAEGKSQPLDGRASVSGHPGKAPPPGGAGRPRPVPWSLKTAPSSKAAGEFAAFGPRLGDQCGALQVEARTEVVCWRATLPKPIGALQAARRRVWLGPGMSLVYNQRTKKEALACPFVKTIASRSTVGS